MKTALIVIGSLIGLILFVIGMRFLLIGIGIITLPINKVESQLEFNQDAIKKTYSIEYCLANYEWFKDTYQDIQQSDGQIKNKQDQLDNFEKSAGARSNWTFEDKQQYNRLTNEVTGIKNYRLDLIGQYNSKSEQLNRVACKELPLFIEL